MAIGEGKPYFRNAISIRKLLLGIIYYQTCDFDGRDFDQFPRIRVAGELSLLLAKTNFLYLIIVKQYFLFGFSGKTTKVEETDRAVIVVTKSNL